MAEKLRRGFENESLECPAGLEHLLLHNPKGRKGAYKALYGVLVFGEKIAAPGTTLVYPGCVRASVREQFPDTQSGHHDHQYESSGRPVTLAELAKAKFRVPAPGKCSLCSPGVMRREPGKKEKKPY